MRRIKPEVEIKYICDIIDKNITAYSVLNDRGLLSENILSQLRNLTEDMAILINNKENNLDLDCSYENVNSSMNYISKISKYKYIKKFHMFLQSTVSHYTPRETDAERLMLNYFRYLCKFKETLFQEFSISILYKLDVFPIYDDDLTKKHYREICKKIDEVEDCTNKYLKRGRFYVNKCRPIYAYGKLYYELTLTKATNYINKFERILAYSKYYIPDNYSIKLSYVEKEVDIFSYNSKIKVIDNYVISIRPCEIRNVGKLLGINLKIEDTYNEYINLMKLLKTEEINLLDLLLCEKNKYNEYFEIIVQKAQNNNISKILETLRNRLSQELPGNNIFRYILVKMENSVIKDQYQNRENSNIGNLYIKNQSIPFDVLPFAMSLYNHNISWYHLSVAIDSSNREDELMARFIKENSEIYNKLYTNLEEVERFGDIDSLIKKYNESLVLNRIDISGKSKIVKENNLLFINSYEKNSIDIIEKIKEYMSKPSQQIIDDFTQNVFKYPLVDLTQDKLKIIQEIFIKNSIAFIHGPAGTGKTKMLEVIATALCNYKKIYLSNTTTSVENLKRRISKYDEINSKFETTNFFIKHDFNRYDILVIDEGSTVSNEEMIKIINKQKYKLVILSGDVFQIQSIKYGNWFSLVYNIFKDDFVHELIKTNRTNDENLLDLWKFVRDDDDRAYTKICNQEYSSTPSEEIFNRECEDEIILCLNYDGLFGINNINKLLQEKNPNMEINIGIDSYKVNDPIIFNDCPRFKNLYNNLKGVIKKIELDEEKDRVWFTVLVDDVLLEEENNYEVLDFIEEKTLIKFYVNNFSDTNEDESGYEHIVPFNLSYAVSIHKSQGLEYESVKIIITSNIEDDITKNIFYTAITRTKKDLKIFWSPESQCKIFDQIKKHGNYRDTAILKQKMQII